VGNVEVYRRQEINFVNGGGKFVPAMEPLTALVVELEGKTFSYANLPTNQYLTVDTTAAGETLAKFSRHMIVTLAPLTRNATAFVDVMVRFVVSKPASQLTISLVSSEITVECLFTPTGQQSSSLAVTTSPIQVKSTAQTPGEYVVSFTSVLPVQPNLGMYSLDLDIDSFGISPRDLTSQLVGSITTCVVITS